VLKADWSLLTQPVAAAAADRGLSSANSQLKPVDPHQFVESRPMFRQKAGRGIEDPAGAISAAWQAIARPGQGPPPDRERGAMIRDEKEDRRLKSGHSRRRDRRRGRAQGDSGAEEPRGDDDGVFFAIYARSAGVWSISADQEPEVDGGPARASPPRGPTSSTATARCWRPTSRWPRCSASRAASSTPTRAIEKLATVLPDLDAEQTYNKLKSGRGLRLAARQLSPRQQNDIMNLGLPGIGFRTEKRRFYPGGSTASHILGLTNIDNQGISGLEKYIDDQGLADLQAWAGDAADLKPVKLSIDLRVQHIVRDEFRRPWSAITPSRPARSCSTSRPAKWSPWRRCRTSIRTTRSTRTTRTS
jgi:hypothetical protein